MKRKVYILLCIILGVILSFLLHAAIEIPAISLLVKDFDKYGFGLSWDDWILIHHVGTVALLILGILMGYYLGRRWWRIIYPHT